MMWIPYVPPEHPPVSADVSGEIWIWVQWFGAVASIIALAFLIGVLFKMRNQRITPTPPSPLNYKAELWHIWRSLPVEDREWFEELHRDVWPLKEDPKPHRDLHPEGYYEGKIIKASVAKTKNKTPYIKLGIETLDGYELIHNLYRPANHDRRAFYYHQLEILGVSYTNKDTDMELLADWLLVPGPLPVRIKIKHETYNGQTRAQPHLVPYSRDTVTETTMDGQSQTYPA